MRSTGNDLPMLLVHVYVYVGMFPSGRELAAASLVDVALRGLHKPQLGDSNGD